MTPKEWVGMQVATLHIRAQTDALMPVTKGPHYRRRMIERGEAMLASLEIFQRRALQRGHTEWQGVVDWNRSPAGEEWRDDIEAALRADQHLAADAKPDWSARRPYDVWPSIFDAARSKVKETFGFEVSDRTLKECLAAYHRWRKPISHGSD